jgi:hypothetical protein
MDLEIKKYGKRLLLTLCLIGSWSYSQAQIELSSGIDLSYPLLLNSHNSKIDYGQVSFGLQFGIAYKPENTQFFPILKPSFGHTRFPLQQFGKNVAALNFDYLNLMLNENYIVRFPRSEVFIYGGIGFSYLNRKGLKITGNGGESMKATLDSTANINKVFPAINIGFEYNYGESAGKDLYLTMGLNFQYILLLNDRNTYYITIKEPGGTVLPFTTNFTGNLISPGFYIAIHYMLHIHHKGGMYL